MRILAITLYYISGFIILWAMVGYPVSIKVLASIYKDRKVKKNYDHQPSVTVMVVAHNEEKVIREKLENIIRLDYPKDKIEYIIASDNSTDKTNEIAEQFIREHPEERITLYKVKRRMGKTNAQNEAQKLVKTDFLVMTDANAMLDRNAVKELMATFTSDDIAYVTGRLVIINNEVSETSRSEASYWDMDLSIRETEGKIQSITAGNGAIYACRTKEYYDFDPIECHDSAMPVYYSLIGKRAIANHDAVAYEKAGEIIEDEFRRKVRMNRVILSHILPDIRILNVFKNKWFSYFYFGHRTCRYLLWAAHLTLFVTNLMLVGTSLFYTLSFILQTAFYILALIRHLSKKENKYLSMIYYYVMTVTAQWAGVFNIITGKSRPFWEKAESTR